MKFKYKEELIMILVGFLLFSFAYFKADRVEKRVDEIVVNNGEDFLVGASTLFAQNASVQLTLEVRQTASASFYLGNGVNGAGDCNDSGEAVRWTTTGLFSCGTFTGHDGIDIVEDGTDLISFDSTELDALTWSDGANTSNLWTFDLSGTDPTLLFRSGGFTFTGTASVSADFEIGTNLIKTLTSSNFVGIGSNSPNTTLDIEGVTSNGSGVVRINNNTSLNREGLVIQRGSGTTGGISIVFDATKATGGRKWEFFATDNGNNPSEPSGAFIFRDGTGSSNKFQLSKDGNASFLSTLNVGSLATASFSRFGTATSGHSLGAANDLLIGDDLEVDGDAFLDGNLTVVGTIDFGDATSFEIPNGTGPTFSALGQVYYDSTLEFFKVATQSAGPGAVIPVKQILWSRTVASSAMDFVSGGRMPLPPKPNAWKYIIVGIVCDVDSGTSVVINLANMNGNSNTETVTCDLDGQEDTSIDTNWNYTSFTKPSSSLEFGTVTGNPDYLNLTVYGYYSE